MTIRTRRALIGWLMGIAIAFGIIVMSSWGETPSDPAFAQSAPTNIRPVSEPFDIVQLDQILREEAPDLSREANQWRLVYQERPLLVVADPRSNRMRIVAPIDAEDVTPEEVIKMMVANFHTALDARYAFVGDGTVVALYLHSLSTLHELDLRSALSQVAELAETFGTTYNSGAVMFAPGTGQPQNPTPSGGGII